MKKVFFLLLCVALLLGITGCTGQSEEDKKFDELTAQKSISSAPASSAPEEPVSSEPEKSEVSETENETVTADDLERFTQKLEWNQLFDIEPNTELSGTLSICVHSPQEIEPWVEAFEAAYPNVEIKIKSLPLYSDEAVNKFIVELNSGECADIVYLCVLSLFKFGESGVFQDLYPYMDADPELNREDFYPDMLKALETKDGKLCTISPGMFLYNVYFNTAITDQLDIDFRRDYPDGMTVKEVTDLYQRCVDEGVLDKETPLTPYGPKSYFFLQTIMDYFDEQNHTSDFENPGFIEHLETMDRIPTWKKVGQDMWAVDASFDTEEEFMIMGMDCFTILDHYWERDDEANRSVWVPLKTEGGKRPFQVTYPMGITSSCQNPELAWEFIKFVMSDKPFPQKPAEGYTDIAYANLYRNNSVPMNRKAFEHLFYAYYDNDELFQYLDDMYSQRNVVSFKDGVLLDAWNGILEKYWDNGLISAEDCAKQLQERAWIYMNE